MTNATEAMRVKKGKLISSKQLHAEQSEDDFDRDEELWLN